MISKDQEFRLLMAARKARQHAYAPYSHYQVGAAVFMESDQIFSGVNVENVSFGGTICAERTAICSAIAAGYRQLLAVAVVTKDGGPPCGICRQFLSEFGDPTIIVATIDSAHPLQRYQLSDLLPHAFSKFEQD